MTEEKNEKALRISRDIGYNESQLWYWEGELGIAKEHIKKIKENLDVLYKEIKSK